MRSDDSCSFGEDFSVPCRSFWIVGVCLLFMLATAGCATFAPKDEVRVLSKSFNTLNEASQPLFDDLAAAERRNGRDNAVVKAKRSSYTGDCAGIGWAEPGFIEGFCLSEAPYFSDIGDPPATLAFRQGIQLIEDYTEVLLILAEGRNIDETTAHVQALGQNVAALVSLVPSAGSAGLALTGALGALRPVIADAAQAKNNEELKRLVLEGAPHIKKLIGALKNGAPEVFNTLIFQSVKSVSSPEALNNEAVAQVHLDRIAAYRVVVSNYVALLDELERSFDQLVIAFEKPRSAASLTLAVQRSAQLAAHAEAWRKAYTSLRAGISR